MLELHCRQLRYFHWSDGMLCVCLGKEFTRRRLFLLHLRRWLLFELGRRRILHLVRRWQVLWYFGRGELCFVYLKLLLQHRRVGLHGLRRG